MQNTVFKEKYKVPTATTNSKQEREIREEEIKSYSDEYEKGYYSHIKLQRNHFELIINLINNLISLLKNMRVISYYSQLGARIKTYSSVKENYLKDKNLDDVFGIELIGATEKEKEYLCNFIENIINIKNGNNGKKQIEKDNGYRAVHFNGELNLDKLENFLDNMSEDKRYNELLLEAKQILNNFKIRIKQLNEQCMPSNIEFQIKTIEVAASAISGTASHCSYKGEKIKDIQDRYNKKPDSFRLGTDIPIMWESSTDQNGRNIMRVLTENEVLRKLYPDLVIKEKKSNVINLNKD